MTRTQASNLTGMDQWFRFWMPYHFEHLEDSKRRYVYLPVNRNYKPLGVTSKEHVDYDALRSQAVVFATDPEQFEGVWGPGCEPLFMYKDGPDSRLDYFARLERLLSRSVKLYEKAVKPNRMRR